MHAEQSDTPEGGVPPQPEQPESTPPPARRERPTTPHGETPYSPMSLLRALTSNPLEVEALRGTEDSHEDEAPADTRLTRTLTVAAAVVLGFGVAISVTNLREAAAPENSPRTQLQQRVLESRSHADDLETHRDETTGKINALQEKILESGDTGAAERLAAYERATGVVAMSGPGVVLILEDSAPLPAEPGTTGGVVNRVTDGDLQLAVNGLWAAGAEAVSINGQRLTSTSAIRRAGDAVLVDFRPLSPPYRITALGDSEDLRATVDGSETGTYLDALSTRFGIRRSWETGEELTVPARTIGTLREASGVQAERGAVPTDSPTTDDPPTNDPEGENS